MKTNTLKKATIASMAIAMGAAIAGSISGTVAWYQYSTRSTVAYQGASAHCSENLQVRLAKDGQTAEEGWQQDLTSDKIKAFLTADGASRAGQGDNYNVLRPVTSGDLAADKAAVKFYKSPIYQYKNYTDWDEASKSQDFIELPLEFRVQDVDGNTTRALLSGKGIYITDLTIEAADVTGKRDIKEAVRVSFQTEYPTSEDPRSVAGRTYAYNASSTNVYGTLDLNQDHSPDKPLHYDWETGTPEDLVYGDEGKTAVSIATHNGSNAKIVSDGSTGHETEIADDSNPRDIKGSPLGTTANDEAKLFKVTVRIYLEGWQALKSTDAGSASALWDDTQFVGAKFNVGMRFSTEAHKDAAE